MYIIVVGGGRVGYYLAKALLNEGHEVVVIEKSAGIAATLVEDLGSICVRGDGCETTVLSDVGTNRANMLIAVTGDDEDNIIISQLGRALSEGHARTIARINNPRNNENFRRLGVESIVNATDLVMNTIERDVSVAPIVHLMRLQSAGMELVELPVTRDSPAHGATVGGEVRALTAWL